MIRILQANINRSLTANQLLYQMGKEKGVDVLLISEQYKNYDSPAWYRDELGTAAIWVREPSRVRVAAHGSGRGYVWVKSAGITYFSCYLTPNDPVESYRDKVDALEDEIRQTGGRMVVAGDFNARGVEWGMPESNARGRYLLEMAARTGLAILNVGNTPTFRRPGYRGTIPDITLASEGMIAAVKDWRVLEDYTGSDHQYITFRVHDGNVAPPDGLGGKRQWNVRNLDRDKFNTVLFAGLPGVTHLPTTGDRSLAEQSVKDTMNLLQRACEAAMTRRRPRHGKRPAYWWTAEIAELRRTCLRLRRKAQRANNRVEASVLSLEHKTAKKALRLAIRRSKATQWRRLAEEVNADPWGLGYKIVTKKLGAMAPRPPMDAETMAHIVNALFPTHPIRDRDVVDVENIPLFTEEELRVAVSSLRNGKAPGPDGIPSEALKIALSACPELLLGMYNTCLKAGLFYSPWKKARLVLIDKGKGDVLAPSSYRPLCMLDTAGKVLEKLLQPRLLSAIGAAGDLCERQYGFRRGRCTIDAINEVVGAVRRAERGNHHSRRMVFLVTLDVKNAFNSARWCDILDALEKTFRVPGYLLRMMKDYLSDRVLEYETLEGNRRKVITAGAAQGSILGPNLWNASYDGLLRLEMPEETRMVGYADDVVALIAARTFELAQLKLNQVMRKVNRWMSDHGLSLAVAKTEIVILTKRRIEKVLPIVVGDEHMQTKPAAKYLGVTVDTKFTFGEHIRRTANKAALTTTFLSRIMANTHGPMPAKRRLLMNTVQSILLYGAEIWGARMEIECYRKRLASVQRRGALRVTCAYRTVSEPAVLVIAGVIPVGLLALERKAIYEKKSEIGRALASTEERALTMRKWQDSWSTEARGRWTARLIPQIEPWVGRKHGEVSYYMTQFLSGHGCFRSYLHRMGRADSPECQYCGAGKDDAEHTLLDCERWAQRRGGIEADVGRLTAENIVGHMLTTEDRWRKISGYIEDVLRTKHREDEMERGH